MPIFSVLLVCTAHTIISTIIFLFIMLQMKKLYLV
jgi:hypothetical protein